MPVMDIRIVRMKVCQWNVFMRVNMRLDAIPFEIMRMLMMHVVAMGMAMREPVMGMFMAVRLGQVQPDACCHQHGGNPEQ